MKTKFVKKGAPWYAEIRKTDRNKQFYGGHRVMLSDGWKSDWPIQYDNGKIAYDTFNPPKYAQALVKQAFAELNKHYPRTNPKRKNPAKSGYKVKVRYHVGGGSRLYYLCTFDGVSLVGPGDTQRASVYSSKVEAVKAIHKLMKTGRNIIGLEVVKA